MKTKIFTFLNSNIIRNLFIMEGDGKGREAGAN